MSYRKQCCVSDCVNASSLADNIVDYYRFPNNEEIKQKWLDAINWPNGNPKSNHYVCADHFNSADLPGLDENTFIVPTIFNPIEVKQEFEPIEIITSPDSQDCLDIDNIKCEMDNNNGDENYDYETYEVVDSPTKADDEIDMPMPKRIKIEGDPINTSSSNEEQPVKQTDISLPKITKVDLSKVNLKVVTVPTEKGMKMVVKTVAKSSPDQAKPCFSGEPVFESQSKLTEDNRKPKHLSRTKKPSKVDESKLEAKETQEFLKYMLQHKNDFQNLPRGTHHKFWQDMEISLKAQGVLRNAINSFKLYNKWKSLNTTYKYFVTCNRDLNEHAFMNDVKEILFNPGVHRHPGVHRPSISELNRLAEEQNSSISQNISAKLGCLRQWLEADTRTFLKYIIDHRAEFRFNGLNRFWNNMELYLNKTDAMRQPATIDHLKIKWKLLMKKYKCVELFEKGEQINLPYIDEMKIILFDPLKPQKNSISIGLTSPFHTTNSSSTSNFQTIVGASSKHNISIKRANTSGRQNTRKSREEQNKFESNYATTKSTSELKQIYLQKKIEGRELKYKLLTKLFNGPNCDIVTNNFKVVTINQINNTNI